MTIKNKRSVKMLKKAKAYAKAVGFILDESPRHVPAIKVVPGNDLVILTPIFFEVGEDRLVEIYQKVSSLGFTGKQILRALLKSYKLLTQSAQDQFRTICFSNKFGPRDILKYLYDWVTNQLEAQRINIGPELTNRSTRNIWYSLGGYRGLVAFFIDALVATLYEFERVAKIEAKLDEYKETIHTTTSSIEKVEAEYMLSSTSTSLKHASKYTEFNPCMTCKNCKVDKYGIRICKACMIFIDETLTVGQVNKMYPKAVINDYGKLRSSYIMENVHDCSFYNERIGCKLAPKRKPMHCMN